MVPARDVLRTAYEEACRMEIEALKPGNVHVFADGHGMSAEQFLISARVSSSALTDPSLPLGRRIRAAIRATRYTVGTNTNLGIVLLCAPIVRAAELDHRNLRSSLTAVLTATDVDDANAVFEAIVLASPGGLGSADAHDVREPARVPLLEAMKAAASRDRIAWQYANGFGDIFTVGLPELERAVASGEGGMWPTVLAYMAFLAAFPDSHITRRHGLENAAMVQREAGSVRAALAETREVAARQELLMQFDRSLKQRGLNPGTSADLTVACLLVHMLGDRLA